MAKTASTPLYTAGALRDINRLANRVLLSSHPYFAHAGFTPIDARDNTTPLDRQESCASCNSKIDSQNAKTCTFCERQACGECELVCFKCDQTFCGLCAIRTYAPIYNSGKCFSCSWDPCNHNCLTILLRSLHVHIYHFILLLIFPCTYSDSSHETFMFTCSMVITI